MLRALGKEEMTTTSMVPMCCIPTDANKALCNCQFNSGSATGDSYVTETKCNRQRGKVVGGDLN